MIDKKIILKHLRLLLGKKKLYHLFRFYMKQGEINKVMKKYGEKGVIKPLLKEAMRDYHWSFDEFYIYHYQNLTHEERNSFVPEYDKNLFCDIVNDYQSSKIFDSKWDTYCHFRDFYKRDVCVIENGNSLDGKLINSFLQNNTRFVLKPDSEACGRGIILIEGYNVGESKRQLLRAINNSKGRFVIEEVITQDERMATFHPQSVNTVRIPTIRFNDRVEIVHPFIRIGRGSAVVDNAGAGGIMGLIDTRTGIVYSACDELNNQFTVHPDTSVPIVGFIVPFWEEAVETATRLASVLPEVRYVGWDLALTKDGWVMIEGNDKGQFVFQIPTQEGFRAELDKYCQELVGKTII